MISRRSVFKRCSTTKYVNIYKHYIIEKYEDLKIVIENFVIKYKIKFHGHVLLLLDILLVVNI